MIKSENGVTNLEGSAVSLASEAASVVLEVVASIAKNIGVSEDEALDTIQKNISIFKLVDSGMEMEEAIRIVDTTNTIQGYEIRNTENDSVEQVKLERSND